MPDLRSSVRQGRLKCRGKAIFSRMADSTRFAIVSLVCSLNVTPDFDEIERSSGIFASARPLAFTDRAHVFPSGALLVRVNCETQTGCHFAGDIGSIS